MKSGTEILMNKLDGTQNENELIELSLSFAFDRTTPDIT